MYIFKNSMKNLLRNKNRNILIFLILLITMSAVATCAIVRQAAEQQINDYIQSFQPSVSMLVDYNKLAEEHPSKEVTNIDGSSYWEAGEMPDYEPSLELLEKWAASSYVAHTSWWLEFSYNSDYITFANDTLLGGMDTTEYYGKDMAYFRQLADTEFEAQKAYYLSDLFRSSSLYGKLYEEGHIVTEDEAAELAARTVFGDKHYEAYLADGISDDLAEIALDMKIGYSGMLDIFISQKKAPTGIVWAHSDFENESYFAEKLLSLSEGHYPYGLNECLVSKKFAEINQLKIGDTVQLYSSLLQDGDAVLELTISGLFAVDYFDATASEDSADFMNYIYTSPETLQQTDFSYYCPTLPTFYLNSTDAVSGFKDMLANDGLSPYITLTDNADELDSAIASVKKISSLATVLVVVTLVLGGSIFLLLSFLAVGERKYEIGVLRSIGMKKNKVIRGYLYETAVIVLLCCVLGMSVGTVISQPVANLMLSQNSSEVQGDDALDDLNIQIDGYDNAIGSYIEGGSDVIVSVPDNGQAETFELNTQLSWNTILLIVLAALVLMIAAVVIAGLYITKFEPIKILSEQE